MVILILDLGSDIVNYKMAGKGEFFIMEESDDGGGNPCRFRSFIVVLLE